MLVNSFEASNNANLCRFNDSGFDINTINKKPCESINISHSKDATILHRKHLNSLSFCEH